MAFGSIISHVIAFLMPVRAPRTALENAVLREQQFLLARMSLTIACVNLLAGAGTVIALRDTSQPLYLGIWAALLVLTSLVLARDWFIHGRYEPPAEVSGRYMTSCEWVAVYVGSLWGSASFLTFGAGFDSSLVVMIVQVGTFTGLCGLLSPLPRFTLRFGIPCHCLALYNNIATESPVGLTLAIMQIILIVSMTLGGIMSQRKLRDNLISMQQASDARTGLEDALTSMNDAFSVHDQDGGLVLANKRYEEWFGREAPGRVTTGGGPFPIANGRWVIQSTRQTSKGDVVTIHTDVTALKERERELIAARKEAEQADEAKSRFLSTMSHELRTPLNIILGFSKLMTEDSHIPLSSEDIREYAGNIRQSGDHLLSLIDDIIDYSKIGLDKYTLKCEPVSVSQLLDGAKKLAETYEDVVNCSAIEVRVAPDFDYLLLDSTAAKRIVVNLLTNALKFGGVGKRVVVRAGIINGERPFISVRDFGPGISEDKLPFVFEAFYQVDGDRSRQFGGTGLGLTLSRHLARLHGGDLRLKNHDGKGLTALVIFPPEALPKDQLPLHDDAFDVSILSDRPKRLQG